MKQSKVTLPSGEYLFQHTFQRIRVKGKKLVWGTERFGLFSKPLPPGNWQLLGADPTNLTEEEAGEIVERQRGNGRYKDYSIGGTSLARHGSYLISSSKQSLDSLAQSLGISKPYVVLKLKTDNNDK